jgi:hypothetical protein
MHMVSMLLCRVTIRLYQQEIIENAMVSLQINNLLMENQTSLPTFGFCFTSTHLSYL